jgi:hypothetical protein
LALIFAAVKMLRDLRESASGLEKKADQLMPKVEKAVEEITMTAQRVRGSLDNFDRATQSSAIVAAGKGLVDAARVGIGAARWVRETVGAVAAFFGGGEKRSASGAKLAEPQKTKDSVRTETKKAGE